MATPKQVNYLLSLLSEAGFRTQYMDASYKELGASMRERRGTVANWIENMSVAEASNRIDSMKRRIEREKAANAAAKTA